MSRLCGGLVEPWLRLNRKVFFRKKAFFPRDVVAAAYLVDSGLFEGDHYTFDVAERGMMRGRLVNVRRTQGLGAGRRRSPVNMPMKLDGTRFVDLFLARLTSLRDVSAGSCIRGGIGQGPAARTAICTRMLHAALTLAARGRYCLRDLLGPIPPARPPRA